MKRLAVFAALLVVFVVWTFPHRQIVEQILARRLHGLDVHVDMGSIAPSLWPLGYRLGDVVVRGPGYSLGVDAVRLGLRPGSDFRADVCGGSLQGNVGPSARNDGTEQLALRFERIDPSACLKVGALELSGSFDGSAALDGLGTGAGSSVLGRSVRAGTLEIHGTQGVVSGTLPPSPGAIGDAAAPPKPIGSWEFSRAALKAHVDGSDVIVDGATAEAEGLHWELSSARLTPGIGARTRINVEMRARRLDDSPRAKAVLGLLPRATEDPDGWRRYRISGTLDAPKIVGLK